MSTGDHDDLGEVEWLWDDPDGGDGTAEDGGPTSAGTRLGVPMLPAVAALAALVAIGFLLFGPGADDPPNDGFATDRDAAAAEPTPEPSVVARSGPQLPAGTGLMLVIGSYDDDLRLVDVDSGTIEHLDLPGEPWFGDDGVVVIKQGSIGQWATIDLRASERIFDALTDEQYLFTHAVPARSGGVWIRLSGPDGGTSWSRIDTRTGDVLETVYSPVGTSVPEGVDGRPLAGPELVNARTGGVFALGADGAYSQVLDGTVLAVGDERLLVTECSTDLDCAYRWVDAVTYEELPGPVPDGAMGWGYLSDGDRVLVIETSNDGSRTARPTRPTIKVVDVATGQAVQTGETPRVEGLWLSPDGRYFARRGHSSIIVTDLVNSTTAVLGNIDVSRNESLVFVQID